MAAGPILTDLKYVKETGQELEILNFHKSFPITCRARVESIAPDGITFIVQPPGSVCLVDQEQTILLSRGLPEAVRARILAFDLATGMLKIGEMSYIHAHFGDRKIARVQPEGHMPVEIECEGHIFSGELADVSLSGIGVLVAEAGFQKEQEIVVTLPLPSEPVALPGKILNITGQDGKQRLSVGFTRNAQEIALVMRYVRDRRTEILAEIEQMYQRALQAQENR